MPRDGAITFDDLRCRLRSLRVVCCKCGRAGRYSVEYLIDRRGCDGKAVDLLADLSADCPRRNANSFNDQCNAHCPDIPKFMSRYLRGTGPERRKWPLPKKRRRGAIPALRAGKVMAGAEEPALPTRNPKGSCGPRLVRSHDAML